MVVIDKNYKTLLEKILKEGYTYEDPNRKGIKRLEIPSYTFRHEFKDGFPAISLKKLAWKNVVTELIWFLKGDTNIKYLVDNGCNIWNKDCANYYNKKYNLNISVDNLINHIRLGATNDGDLGKVYGHYWRNFNGVDQIAELINDMINKPMSSELLVVARDPSHKDEQALPCCHYGFQIVMRPLTPLECGEYGIVSGEYNGIRHSGYGFELHWNQRSCDLFLGIPFNIASYALLALILEKITGHKALAIQGDLKKVHLYDNSIEAAIELIKRESSEDKVKLLVDKVFDIDIKKYSKNLDMLFRRMSPKDFSLENYNPQEPLKVEMLSRS